MKKLLLLFCCLFVSCKSPPPIPTLGVTISEQMYRTATCRLKDDQLVWCKDDAPKDFVVRAKRIRKSTVTYVSFECGDWSAYVLQEHYKPQEPTAPLKEISFFHVEWGQKYAYEKRLCCGDEGIFWLQKNNGYYLITNITHE
jgi:hypothetical protein